MSFLFALLQLVSFASLDAEPAAHRVDPQNIRVAAPSKADLVQRPMNPCTGTACR